MTKSFRIGSNKFMERLPHTGVFYLASVGYFDPTASNGGIVFRKALRIFEDVFDGTGALRMSNSGGWIAKEEKVSINMALSTPAVNAESGKRINHAFFEAGRTMKDSRGVPEWRPQLLVSYAENRHAMSVTAEPAPAIHSLTCLLHHTIAMKLKLARLSSLLQDLWQALESEGCLHGITTVGSSDFEIGSLSFDYGAVGVTSWSDRIATWKWINAGNERVKRLRGAYWGNFLSKQMSERLGSVDKFIKDYREHKNNGWAPEALARKTRSGGMWLQASPDPFEDVPGTMSTGHDGIQNALWLEGRFREKNLLW